MSGANVGVTQEGDRKTGDTALALRVLTCGFLLILAAAPSRAQQRVALYGGLSDGLNAPATVAPPGCPVPPDEPLDSVSVPVNETVRLRVFSLSAAPPGGAVFQLEADDPSIVAAGDRLQSFLPMVTIAEGEQLSNPFSIFGIKLGQTILRTTPLTDGFNASTTPTAAWELGDKGKDKFVDANPEPGFFVSTCRESDASPNLSSDKNVLTKCGRKGARGAVTDGVSPLLVRLSSGLEGTACFEVVSMGPPEQGTISPSVAATQTVSGSVEQAFAFFTPPAAFDASGDSRMVEIEVTFILSIGNSNPTRVRAQTMLVRPPVVLVHGIWGRKNTFSSDWVRNDLTHTTEQSQYQSTNAEDFAINAPKIQGFVRDAVTKSRKKGYSTTKADVVAHSMGGLLTRLYTLDTDRFLRPDNFNRGDVGRLATVDTPHYGSSLANLLVNLNDHRFSWWLVAFSRRVGAIDKGAVCDLAENSAALGTVGTFGLPILAITGNGGQIGALCGDLETVANSYCGNEANCLANQIDPYRFTVPNDCIVPLTSQQGGAPVAANFANVHATDLGGTACTQAAAVRTRVLNDLDSPSAFGNGLPAALSTSDGRTRTVTGKTDDATIFSRQCGIDGPMRNGQQRTGRGQPRVAVDPRVQILSPAPHQIFTPGDTVHVEVHVDGSVSVANVGIASPFAVDATETPPYDFDLPIPDTFAGPADLTAGVVTTSDESFQSAPVAIVVVPADTPQNLVVDDYVALGLPPSGEPKTIIPIAVYVDGVERDLRSSQVGTTYASSDGAVVAVNAEGVVIPVGAGLATITTMHDGIKAFTTVEVSASGPPPPPKDVTAALTVRFGGFRPDRNSGFFVQEVRVTNPGQVPVPGPLVAVVSGISEAVFLVNYNGETEIAEPLGTPFLRLALADGLTLQPAEQQSIKLQFLNPSRVTVAYDLHIVQAQDP